MSRRHLEFACEGAWLAGTLDEGPGRTGLLIVGGGSEVRAGAFNGQAELAARVAAAGHPVFRFDRRGVGDSEGDNGGFLASGPDIAAALAAFRHASPGLARVVGFGNCDAASALMLGAGAGCDALVLANPWTLESHEGELSPAAIRARYGAKLRDPREWLRLASGKVALGKLARGLGRAARAEPEATSLAQAMAAGLAAFEAPVRLLVAERDRTGQAFLAGWDKADPRLAHCSGASHAFVEPDARKWLFEQLMEALRG